MTYFSAQVPSPPLLVECWSIKKRKQCVSTFSNKTILGHKISSATLFGSFVPLFMPRTLFIWYHSLYSVDLYFVIIRNFCSAICNVFSICPFETICCLSALHYFQCQSVPVYLLSVSMMCFYWNITCYCFIIFVAC